MHAWKCVAWGGPSQLEMGRMPDPECGPAEVEIEVEACGVNLADLLLIARRSQVRPELPFVPGIEVAGTISRVGSDVTGFEVGDRVAAYTRYGAYAEKVAVPAAQVCRIPEAISFTLAAAFPVAYASAELALDRAGLAADEVVVIGGAGGALGSACVELARQRGATIVASVGDADKEAIARACGADEIVSSRSRHLYEELHGVAPHGVDVIIDPVGGVFFEETLRALNFAGRVIVLGFASDKIPSLRMNHLLARHQSIIGSSFALTCLREPERIAQEWPKLVDLFERGEIKPRVSKTLPFKDLPRALNLLKERKVAGRVVLEL